MGWVPTLQKIPIKCYFYKPIPYPYTVEDISIREDPDVQVWLNYLVEFCILLVPEESVRHPHFGPLCHGQVFDLPPHVVECQTVIVPLLAKSNLNAELHLHIVYLLKAAHKQVHQNFC